MQDFSIPVIDIPIASIASIAYQRYQTPLEISLKFVKSCKIINQQIVELLRTDGKVIEYGLGATIIKYKDVCSASKA